MSGRRLLPAYCGDLAEVILDGKAFRIPSQWRGGQPNASGSTRTFRQNMQAYAKANGEAFALLADGRGLLFYTVCGKLRQKTYQQVRLVGWLPASDQNKNVEAWRAGLQGGAR